MKSRDATGINETHTRTQNRRANLELITFLKSVPGLTSNRQRNLGLALILLAAGYLLPLLVILPALVLVFLLIGLWESQYILAKILAAVLAIPSMGFALVSFRYIGGAAAKLRRRARQRTAPNAFHALRSDRRPPVIYLRSFGDDGQTRFAETDQSRHMFLLDSPTEEEDLALALRKAGPFLAIGNPGEKLPLLGAARLYVPNEHWQNVVLQLLSVARLVILRVGETPGLMWEVAQIVKKMPAERVLFFIPGRDFGEEYHWFQENASPLMPQSLPRYTNASRFIAFDETWRPQMIRRVEASQMWGENMTDAPYLTRELAPILRRLGVKPPGFFSKYVLRFAKLTLIAIFIVLIALPIAFFAAGLAWRVAPDVVFQSDEQKRNNNYLPPSPRPAPRPPREKIEVPDLPPLPAPPLDLTMPKEKAPINNYLGQKKRK